jgi:predicted dehydrogenase
MRTQRTMASQPGRRPPRLSLGNPGSYSGSVAVRIGLAGAGRRAATAHAPALAACPQARFAGVWAPRPEAAQSLAEAHGVPAYRSFDELLAQCDAVAFAVPSAAQPDLAGAAARRGQGVLLEVPIAADLAGAQELARAVAAAGVTSQVALMWRYASAVRDFLAARVPRTYPQGGSGRLVSAAFGARSSVPAWRIEMGVLRSFGPYLVDLLDAALGEVGGVTAHGDPEGWLGLMLEHAKGRFSEASLSATATPDSQRADIEIFGSGGAAAIDCQDAAGRESFDTMYREFAAAVERGEPHELDVRRGLHVQQVIEAAEADLLGIAVPGLDRDEAGSVVRPVRPHRL